MKTQQEHQEIIRAMRETTKRIKDFLEEFTNEHQEDAYDVSSRQERREPLPQRVRAHMD